MLVTKEQTIGQLNCVLVSNKPQANNQSPGNLSEDSSTNWDRVVILCHGFGASGQDLVSLASEFFRSSPQLSKTLFVFPAAPVVLDPGYDSRAWWMIDVQQLQLLMAIGETRVMRDTLPPELELRRTELTELIDLLKLTYHLTADQIVVGGFSQGAMLATDVALHYPEALGGLIIWSGALICQQQWTEAAGKQQALQIAQSHGTRDPILSFEGAMELKALFEAAGHHVRFGKFEGDHTIAQISFDLAANVIEGTP